MARDRISKKELKSPDQFVTVTARSLQWVEANRQLATWGGVAIIAVLVAIAATVSFRASRQSQANADLGQAMIAYRAGATPTASQQLLEVARRWKSTSVGQMAAIMAANSELRLNNYESAATILSEFQPSLRDLPPYFQQELLFDWGVALENKGDWKEAAAKYHAASEITGPYTALANLGEARSLEKSDQPDQARDIYRRVHEQYPDLPGRDLIRGKAGL